MPKPIARLPKNLMGKKLGDEWVFLNLESGVYYGLNETGSVIWDELVKRRVGARSPHPERRLLERRSAAGSSGTVRSARRSARADLTQPRMAARPNRSERVARDELKREKDTEKVLDRLQEIFGVARTVLQKDLKKFLNELKKEGLVEIAA